ncbi:MAG: mechanosensitive ion channel [Magnetococcales bacterium]|nr:mechanosensitive ion channel [Magnetococcales bacterium]
MDGLTLIAVTLAGVLAIFLAATLLTLPFRLKKSTPPPVEHPPAETSRDPVYGEASLLGIFLNHTSRPLAVLLLTMLIFRVLKEHPGLMGSLTIDQRYIQGWYLFWLALLFFNCYEALGRLFYTIRKRHFPASGLILFLLRLMLIGATAFSILHFVLDFDTSKLFTSTAVVAAVLGIALREVLSNFLSGVSMNLVGTVEPSQWISLGDKEGEIIQRNWRETRLRSTAGHILIIPNSVLAGGIIHNMTWPTPLRRHQLTLPLGFNASPQEVREALVAAALSVPEVDRWKQPDAYVYEYRDYGVVYLLRYWSRTYFDRTKLEGTVRERVWYQLKRRGLEIPFPHGGDLNVAAAPTNLAVQEDPLARNLRLLQANGFFQPLFPPEELRQLAARLQYRVFGPGEAIFRQGEPGSVCYLVASGRLQGYTRYEGISTTQEFTVGPGQLIGEMALMTGLPRISTICALGGEVELLEFSRELFERCMEDATIAAAVSAKVVERSRLLFEDLKNLEPGLHQEFKRQLALHPVSRNG